MTPSPADFAASEFRRRQALASEAVAQGRMTGALAQAHLLPWLAIAAATGADLPELREEVQFWRPEFATPTAPVGLFGLRGWHEEVRTLAPWQICDPAEYREVLARARDAVLNLAREDSYARGILTLAAHLNLRPWHPHCAEQKEAA